MKDRWYVVYDQKYGLLAKRFRLEKNADRWAERDNERYIVVAMDKKEIAGYYGRSWR